MSQKSVLHTFPNTDLSAVALPSSPLSLDREQCSCENASAQVSGAGSRRLLRKKSRARPSHRSNPRPLREASERALRDRWFWVRRCRANTIERVLESHGTRASRWNSPKSESDWRRPSSESRAGAGEGLFATARFAAGEPICAVPAHSHLGNFLATLRGERADRSPRASVSPSLVRISRVAALCRCIIPKGSVCQIRFAGSSVRSRLRSAFL